MTGGRHARRAALPPAGFVRDRQPGPGSLVVTVAGESGGTEAVFDFSALPGPPALLAACAAGFGRMAGPDQPWRAAATCANGFKAIREFLRWAAALDLPPQAPEDITPTVQAQWRLSRPGTVYGRACQLAVRQWLSQVPGIPAVTVAASARRIPAGPAPSEAAYIALQCGLGRSMRHRPRTWRWRRFSSPIRLGLRRERQLGERPEVARRPSRFLWRGDDHHGGGPPDGRETARVTVSTAHKAKGREWDSVRIGRSVDDDGVQCPLPGRAESVLIPRGSAGC